MAAGAAAASAAAQLRQQEEEETMSTYTNQDVSHYEFKILRTGNFSSFSDPYRLQQVIQEQSQYGWVLVEKFDNYRLRFKRLLSERLKDQNRSGDPYQTWYGAPQWLIAVILLVIFVVVFGIVIFAAILSSATSSHTQ